jgi:leucyl-tRNA synthetase
VKEDDALTLKKHCHKAIEKITHDISNFQFNTAISQLMELINTIAKIGTNQETAETMTKLIAPFAPFIAESIWETLGYSHSIHQESWPTFSKALTIDDEITIVIQVNGKVRDKIISNRTTKKDALTELARSKENVKKHIENKEIVKTIVVPERLINFVVK